MILQYPDYWLKFDDSRSKYVDNNGLGLHGIRE